MFSIFKNKLCGGINQGMSRDTFSVTRQYSTYNTTVFTILAFPSFLPNIYNTLLLDLFSETNDINGLLQNDTYDNT